jgi:3-hydroxybutyryl-CoA dehydrogenase
MKPDNIKKVGIVGAGTMGQGIAISCALAGYQTLMYDLDSSFCDKAISLIQKSLTKSVEKGKLSQEDSEVAFSRIVKANKLQDLQVDLVIEAIVESLQIKQNLFIELEQINSGNAILASNTSSISITQIASVLQNPANCIGLHFFNPANVMKLVEVISGLKTSPELVQLMKDFAKSLGKVSVEVKDSPGFIVNRVARHFYVEALKVLQDEVADHETIDLLMRSAGFKMGPFGLMDLIGIDVNYAVTKSVHEGFSKAHRFLPSKIQYEKIEVGQLGRKTGKGFYDYEKF